MQLWNIIFALLSFFRKLVLIKMTGKKCCYSAGHPQGNGR